MLGDAASGAGVSPYVAPARARDLSGLPKTYLEVGSAETFRDEVIDYAQRLAQAGNQVELHLWPGGWHWFDQLAPEAAVSQRAVATQRAHLDSVPVSSGWCPGGLAS